MTLPHWATSFGWLALSFYLALYLPGFVALARVAVHRLRIPAIVAVPLVYLGLELARAHLLTGFAMTGLGHSQYRWTDLHQIADLAGIGGVGAVMMLVAAAVVRDVSRSGGERSPGGRCCRPARCWGFAWRTASWRLGQQPTRPGPKVALIQGSIDITMKMDETQTGSKCLRQYADFTREALRRADDLDLIVWPETMFRYPWFHVRGDTQPPAGLACNRRRGR